MRRKPSINRVELLHAINRWCAGRFNPLIAFPVRGGFQNVVYLYDTNHVELLEESTMLMSYLQQQMEQALMAFTEPLRCAPATALTYKEWIETGDEMQAIERKTSEVVHVLPVYNDDGSVSRYVSSERSYKADELIFRNNSVTQSDQDK